jgi:hypothetical protein
LLTTVIMAACTSVPVESEGERVIREINENHDGALVKPEAPFIADEMVSDEYKREFILKVCGHSKKMTGKQDQECAQKLEDTFGARLAERYKYAIPDVVFKKCNAYPIECKKAKIYEQWVRDNHNQNVELSREQKISDYRQYRIEQRALQNAQEAEAFSRMGNAFSNSAQQFNNSKKSTNCRTMPNGIGGFTTTCN